MAYNSDSIFAADPGLRQQGVRLSNLSSAQSSEAEWRRMLGLEPIAPVAPTGINRNALPQTLSAMADPYSAERDQLIKNPSAALSNSPFFKFMQERAMNATAGKNRAAGLRNSGQGQLALQDSATKSAAQYYFPYLQSLGSPSTGANAFFEAYKFANPNQSFSSSGGSRSPRTSLSNMGTAAPQQAPLAFPLETPSQAGLPYTDAQWQGAMGYAQPQLAMTAGTGYIQANPYNWEDQYASG